jgi:dienelactone hydrolase
VRRVVRIAALLAVGLLAVGCGGSGDDARPAAATPRAPQLFAYDATKPLAFQDRGRVNGAYPVAVHDVSFASDGGRVDAYLALPPAGAPRPAAIYVHGAGGERSQLLAQALWLAGRGAVTLALTAPSTQAGAPEPDPSAALRQQRDLAARDVVAVRRAVDLLLARDDVDHERIGFVGWSAGARTGAIAAGVEPRLRALVLMSAGASPVSEYAAQAPAELKADVTRILGQADPLRLVRRARPGSILLQNGERDEVVPRPALEALAAAAPQADVRWYDADHALDAPAFRDQLDWLSARLGLRGRQVAGARTGP